MTSYQPMTFVDLLIHYGRGSSVAKALGVSRNAVSLWKKRGIPYSRQCQIQIHTNGKLRASKV